MDERYRAGLTGLADRGTVRGAADVYRAAARTEQPYVTTAAEPRRPARGVRLALSAAAVALAVAGLWAVSRYSPGSAEPAPTAAGPSVDVWGRLPEFDTADEMFQNWGVLPCPSAAPRPESVTREQMESRERDDHRLAELVEESGWMPRSMSDPDTGARQCVWTRADAIRNMDLEVVEVFGRPDGELLGHFDPATGEYTALSEAGGGVGAPGP